MKESQRLYQQLQKSKAQGLNKRSICDLELVKHFVDNKTRQLLKEKVRDMIDDLPLAQCKGASNKQKLIDIETYPQKTLIYQLVFNKLIKSQLNLPGEGETKRIFEVLKMQIFNMIEWQADGDRQFIINDKRLRENLKQINIDLLDLEPRKNFSLNSLSTENSLKTIDSNSSIENPEGLRDYDDGNNLLTLNYGLLKEALWVHMFELVKLQENINNLFILCKKEKDVSFWTKIKKSFYSFIFEKSTLPTKAIDTKELGYGLKVENRQGVLRFSGIIEEFIMEHTLVVQIIDKWGFIIREFEIHFEKRQPCDRVIHPEKHEKKGEQVDDEDFL